MMMHPTLAAAVANTLFADRSAPARPRSVKRGAATSGRRSAVRRRGSEAGRSAAARAEGIMSQAADVVIRRATEADAPALARLGVLDSDRRAGEALAAAARNQAVLVAEADGTIEAALALDGSQAVADPFRPSAIHAQLLAVRARQLGGRAPRRRSRGRLVLHPRTS
jgi:hypothetical protein